MRPLPEQCLQYRKEAAKAKKCRASVHFKRKRSAIFAQVRPTHWL